MRILFLDDDEFRHKAITRTCIGHELVRVYTVPEFVSALGDGPYDVIFLDHDLGGKQMVESDGEEETGYHAALAIIDLSIALRPKMVVIHSYNPVGAEIMCRKLIENGISAYKIPFDSRWEWLNAPWTELGYKLIVR